MDNKDVIGSYDAAITTRQFEAFRMVYTLGLSQTQAAKAMGISQQAVQKLLKAIRKKYPDCVPNTNQPKLYQFNDRDNGNIKERW